MIEGDQKEIPSDVLFGKTSRYAMQTLGTDLGCDCMHPDFWIKAELDGKSECEKLVFDLMM